MNSTNIGLFVSHISFPNGPDRAVPSCLQVTIAQGGVLPNIHAVLLPKKSSKTDSEGTDKSEVVKKPAGKTVAGKTVPAKKAAAVKAPTPKAAPAAKKPAATKRPKKGTPAPLVEGTEGGEEEAAAEGDDSTKVMNMEYCVVVV